MKKVLGIISIVLFFIVTFQSCAAGLGEAITNDSTGSGGSGMFLSVCMLIAGIILLVSKNKKSLVITSIVFYVLGGIVGMVNVGIFADLQIWSVLNLIFAGLLIFHLIKNKELYSKKNIEEK
ncbi:hypothetical protein [Hathewaya massiliensis]|uniref:hypothetical protein n=1 Tax=Hathewaya massiliensis TaxID=1964382 RepID=UPI001157372C|nr:hypothetical protein [Hathewaya massiliensis]